MGSGSSGSEDDDFEDYSTVDFMRDIEKAKTGFCPKCGSRLAPFKEKDGSGSNCPKCGWSMFFSDDFPDLSRVQVDIDLAKARRKFDKVCLMLNKECPLTIDAYTVSKMLVLFFEMHFGCDLSPETLSTLRSIVGGFVAESSSKRV
jgi:hypothetical protein